MNIASRQSPRLRPNDTVPLRRSIASSGGDATAIEVGCETSADAVQLVSVPGEFENPVE